MDDATILDDFVTREGLGVRLDIDRQLPETANVLRLHANRQRSMLASDSATAAYPRLPPIHFDWIDNGSLNAFAFREQGRYFIGVNVGTLYIFNLVFRRMLASPHVLRWVGNPNEETPAKKPLPSWHPHAGYLQQSGADAGFPKNELRRKYGFFLELTAMDFLTWHELTHIAHGHVDYRMSRYGMTSLGELGSSEAPSEPPMTRQALEVAADIGAVSCGIGAIQTRMTDQTKRPGDIFEPFYRDPVQAVFNWAFAVCTFFRLFGDSPFAGVDLTQMPYPPIRIREVSAISAARSFIIERWNQALAEPCLKACFDASIAVERAFESMTGQPPATQGLKEAWGDPAKQHMRTNLLANWENVRAELVHFAFGPLPN